MPNANLNQETQDIWNQNAEWWDDYIGPEGNEFHRTLIEPTTLRLLELKAGETVLEIACGNGQFARRMAELDVNVVATDFSEKFLERARAHTQADAAKGRIEYQLLDATDEAQLLSLGIGRFDAAVANMALMDIADIAPLFRALARLLKPRGRFVFSVMHPCFNSVYTRFALEEDDSDGIITETRSVKITGYIRPTARKGLGIIGQPAPHYYFHRPLSVLFDAAFAAGLVLDGLVEPTFSSSSRSPRWFSWSNFPDIPPALVARLRVIP